MVTLPSHAADHDGRLIHELADAGVNVFRINTAHDTVEIWKGMAAVIAAINENRAGNAKIKNFADLAGPKIRTGKIRRLKQPVAIGSNKYKKEILICRGRESTKPEGVDPFTLERIPARIVVDKKFFKKIRQGRPLKIVDANGKKAIITVIEMTDKYAKGSINKRVYVDKSAKFYHKHHDGSILNIENQIDPVRLFVDDLIVITEKDIEGRSAVLDKLTNKVLEPARIGCSFRGIVSRINAGDKIFIDDGKIGLKVIKRGDDSITCRVTHAKDNGTLLKEEKGINFPDTHVKTPALTKADSENMFTVLEFADHLGLSFCQESEDIRDLQALL